jgi:predicted small secreted protein
MPSLSYRLATLPILLLLAVLMTAVSGCETSEGFGRDLQSLGEGIEEEAEETD